MFFFFLLAKHFQFLGRPLSVNSVHSFSVEVLAVLHFFAHCYDLILAVEPGLIEKWLAYALAVQQLPHKDCKHNGVDGVPVTLVVQSFGRKALFGNLVSLRVTGYACRRPILYQQKLIISL